MRNYVSHLLFLLSHSEKNINARSYPIVASFFYYHFWVNPSPFYSHSILYRKVVKISQIISHFSLFAYFIPTVGAVTIHVSPKGQDLPNCGASTQKCQTIDFILNQTDNDLTLVFETSSTESLKYNLTKSLGKRNGSISVHFVKDDQQGMNPKIYGNHQSFIKDGNEEVKITINSIDLHDFYSHPLN